MQRTTADPVVPSPSRADARPSRYTQLHPGVPTRNEQKTYSVISMDCDIFAPIALGCSDFSGDRTGRCARRRRIERRGGTWGHG